MNKFYDSNIIFASKALANHIKRAMISEGEQHNLPQLTGMQYALTRFINEQPQRVKQKDIETHFNIRRSSATVILQTMEKNNLIIRKTSSKDARVKIIELTNLGQEVAIQAKTIFEIIDNKVKQNINEEEKDIFFKVVNQIIKNLETTGDIYD